MTSITRVPFVPADENPPGIHLIEGWLCQYPPSICVEDLVKVDFDRKAIGGEGLYLLEHIANGEVDWRGCRRFDRWPTCLAMDETGKGQWKPAPEFEETNLRVVGQVLRVYKPS